ncbi:MAG: hypothetical protein PHH70_02440 [Candidatus Gracilibacteria bacterium]|nr:hypothetical protein [Candidatus Gracilibacteria bacterium]
MKTLAIKRSFTIQPDLSERLGAFPNQSKVVNEALSVYFERTEYLEKAEENFWGEKIRAGLADVASGRVTALHAKGGEITKETLAKTLWS